MLVVWHDRRHPVHCLQKLMADQLWQPRLNRSIDWALIEGFSRMFHSFRTSLFPAKDWKPIGLSNTVTYFGQAPTVPSLKLLSKDLAAAAVIVIKALLSFPARFSAIIVHFCKFPINRQASINRRCIGHGIGRKLLNGFPHMVMSWF